MPTKRERAEQFKRRAIPVRVRKDSIKEKPFVVAYENTDGYRAGQRLTEDQFYEILDDYDAVMVHWREGSHPSQDDHFLQYGQARKMDLDDDLRVSKRKRSREVVGDFGWYHHGRHLAVEMSIGLHCLDDEVWQGLP